MKRDWDLIRQQLTDIEEEKDLFKDLPKEPKWTDQTESLYVEQLKNYNEVTNRTLGHLELLVNSGYVEGIKIVRSLDGGMHYGAHSPRLTMEGHELLDTIRSKSVWDKITTKAKTEGLELTLDAIKQLSSWAIKSILG